ncbi:ubiquinol-cytochrome c reductase iron-sulfur subunit [Paenibacillus thermoaerophilus]|uniref:Ubiquinol-cytochrome c reductase iron-sulfur subunit n=1 Tax=Paenibacillus thermoaerophilus TaxID=1215385 RepID=A0ABW2V2X0_9BACL|nr:ubiquinol-cytochrome c reductase iron-sulfur subunit [Paenibacillus thermoaerophilus]TMV18687.1 ubiquinol-cytochrome c reductase iron-sulfur subunit [Paenibacillus thermoaerophilus]
MQEKEHKGEKPVVKREMSRRQFLSYTLGGAGAFMAAGMTVPMIRFAVDPIIRPKSGSDYVKVIEESKVTTTPTEVKFKKHQVDGWYESDPEFAAWIAKDDSGKIYALSPICKHLGCTVAWNTDSRFPNEFFCPCHEAHYDKDGKQKAVASAPLDEYEVKLEGGWVYLGPVIPNSRVK